MSDNPIMEPAKILYDQGKTEPKEPTVETEVTEGDQAPELEVETLENPDDEAAKAESETEESEADDDEVAQYIELDGKEYDLNEVKKWRDGHLMQADYTRKTQALSEDKKAFETERTAEREELLKAKTEISEMRDLLSVLVQEDEAIDWVELKENDPEQYIELKEKADKRKAALDKVKAEQSAPTDDPAVIQQEQVKLYQSNPDWLDKDGKVTEAAAKDFKLINDYAVKAGYTTEEFSKMTKAHNLITLLKAAKYDELQQKGEKIKQQREKVPVIVKPKAKTTEQPKNAAEILYGGTKAING